MYSCFNFLFHIFHIMSHVTNVVFKVVFLLALALLNQYLILRPNKFSGPTEFEFMNCTWLWSVKMPLLRCLWNEKNFQAVT